MRDITYAEKCTVHGREMHIHMYPVYRGTCAVTVKSIKGKEKYYGRTKNDNTSI